MEIVRLFIVADDPLVRSGLAILLADEPDCDVVYQVSSAEFEPEMLLDELDEDVPHAVIWDLGWEVAESLPIWHEIEVPVVALLPDGLAADEVWASGVRALLSRETEVERLVAAVRTAVYGLTVLDPLVTENLLSIADEDILTDTVVDALTSREKEVLQLVAEGLTNKAIAQQLHISNHTVKFHVNAIMTKLHAQSRTEAVVQATRLGLLLL